MKIRAGFVSNSSSSSFIIGMKKEKLTINKLMDNIGINKENLFYQTIKEYAGTLINDLIIYENKDEYLQDIKDDNGYSDEDIKEYIEEGYYKKLLSLFDKCKYVGVSDLDYENIFYKSISYFENDDLIIINEN